MSRCDEFMQWTEEELEAYMKVRRSLTSKGKGSKSSPPRSKPPESDVDYSLVAKLESVTQSVDMIIETMSTKLMSVFSSMLKEFRLAIIIRLLQIPLQYRGIQLACLSLRPVVPPSAPRAEKGSEDPVPHEDDLASASFMDENPETVRHPPDSGSQTF